MLGGRERTRANLERESGRCGLVCVGRDELDNAKLGEGRFGSMQQLLSRSFWNRKVVEMKITLCVLDQVLRKGENSDFIKAIGINVDEAAGERERTHAHAHAYLSR